MISAHKIPQPKWSIIYLNFISLSFMDYVVLKKKKKTE